MIGCKHPSLGVFLAEADTEADKGTPWQAGHSGALRLSCRLPHLLQSQAVPLAHEGESLSFPVQALSSSMAGPLSFLASPGHHWKLLCLSGPGSVKSSEIFLHQPCGRLGNRGKAWMLSEILRSGARPHGAVSWFRSD